MAYRWTYTYNLCPLVVAISRKITQKMPSPPMIPHDVQVKQKEGQTILMWTIGALVDLLHLEWYLKIK